MRERTFGDFVKAFFAFVALLALVGGVPGALAVFVGWPLPGGAPTLDWLQQEITVTTFLHILTVVVWLAWAQFTACVLVEVKAAVSGVGVPGRVPGAGPGQLLARQLVAAMLLVGTAASLAEQASHAAAQADDGNAARQYGDTKYYRIQPPEGRHHDSLWEIAERHLGDGRRYKEIYALNKDRVQPDGSGLSEASLIRPGRIMEMPGDAQGGDLVGMPGEAPGLSPEVQRQIHDYARTRDHAGDHAEGSGGGSEQGSSGLVQTGGRAHAARGATQASLPSQRHASDQQQSAVSSESGFGLAQALVGAPLVAAGLLAAELVDRGGTRGLPPHTEALLDELLPTWRNAVAAAG